MDRSTSELEQLRAELAKVRSERDAALRIIRDAGLRGRMGGISASLLVLLLSLAPFAGAADVAAPLAFYAGGAAIDLATTDRALRIPGAVEVNPAVRSAAGRYGIKAGMVAGMTVLDVHLQRRGRKRAAWVCRLAWVAAHAAVAVHNSRQRARP